MRQIIRNLLTCSPATLVVAMASPAVGQLDVLYATENLGTIDGTLGSEAYGLNEFGSVVGRMPVAAEYPMAYHWQNESFTDIGQTTHYHHTYNTYRGEAYAISNADQIAGGGWIKIKIGDDEIFIFQAFLFRPATTTDLPTTIPGDVITNLGTFGGFNSSATGISNNNHVVGWADVGNTGFIHAFLITPQDGVWFTDGNGDGINDIMIDLGTFGGAQNDSAANDCNDAGEAVGYSYMDTEAAYHGFVVLPLDTDDDGRPDTWHQDVDNDGNNDLMVDIGTLGGTNSWARAINNSRQIVGEADTDEFDTRAFIWEDGLMTDLGTLGGNNSSAADVNNLGQVVGWAETVDGKRNAFLWSNGTMIDLNSLLVSNAGLRLVEARGINDEGEIIGWGKLASADGQSATRAFLLRAVDPDSLDDASGSQADDDPAAESNENPEPTNGDEVGIPLLGDREVAGDTATTGEDAVTPTSSPCGLGAATAVPLTMVGLFGLRRRR